MVFMKRKNRKSLAFISSLRCLAIIKFVLPLLIGFSIGSLSNSNNTLNIFGDTLKRTTNDDDYGDDILNFENKTSTLPTSVGEKEGGTIPPSSFTVQKSELRSTAYSIFSSTNHENSGWHPIYVYYGKSKEGLQSSEAPLFMKSNAFRGSQVKQDEILIQLIKAYGEEIGTTSPSDVNQENNDDGNKPYFVDLAANDAVSLSNTYRLENSGWEGLCIEPNPVYWYRLAHRKCIVAGAFVGGKEDLQQVDVSLENKEFGGIVGEKFDNTQDTTSKQKRYTISIRTMFEQFHVPKIVDYLSLDVEGAEGLIMNDFPFDTYTIRFITIERPKLDVQAILKEKKYQFVAQLISWGETLWVHESILETLSMEKLNDIVSKTKSQERKPRKGQSYFDLKKGSLITL